MRALWLTLSLCFVAGCADDDDLNDSPGTETPGLEDSSSPEDSSAPETDPDTGTIELDSATPDTLVADTMTADTFVADARAERIASRLDCVLGSPLRGRRHCQSRRGPRQNSGCKSNAPASSAIKRHSLLAHRGMPPL